MKEEEKKTETEEKIHDKNDNVEESPKKSAKSTQRRKKSLSFKKFLVGTSIYLLCTTYDKIYKYLRKLCLPIVQYVKENIISDYCDKNRCFDVHLNLTERIQKFIMTFSFEETQKNVGNKSDLVSAVYYIAFFSILMALVRIYLVYALVPRYLAPRRLAVFMRCKSTHLLSKSPTSKAKLKRTESNETFETMRHAFQRSIGHEDAIFYENSLTYQETQEMFAAPRFATAIFRILYCITSTVLAIRLFRHADFWPTLLGGTHSDASTKHCWNLSAGLSILGNFEYDFDHYNLYLTKFFIFVASHQLHSVCFHFVSMLVLFFSQDKSFVSIKTSLQAYCRPFTWHVVSLLLLVICFVVSSLRRLGSIGIFTMDLSSLFMNALQACINAPPSYSRFRNKYLVRVLYFGFVIPSFLYCRFFILFFIVWRSAAFESLTWLHQIEHATVDGLADYIYAVVNVLLCILMILNLVYLRRLIIHDKVWESMGFSIKL